MQEHANSIDRDVLEALKELVDEDDPEFVVDLLQEYLVNAQQNIQVIREAAKSKDTVTLAKTAHSLKGASGNIGATKMASLSRRLEELGKSDDAEQAIRVIDELENEFTVVRSALQTEIDSF